MCIRDSPFASEEVITQVLQAAAKTGAAAPAVPVTDTIKVADKDGKVVTTPDRATLYAVPVSYTHLDVYKRQG